MSEWVKVTASDGNELSAYVARPQGEPIGAIVVVQEIFGVNKSIQAVADSYAKDGFLAVAPAIFDRIERDVNLGYDEAGMKKAFSLYPKLNPDDSLKDIAAAFNYAKGIVDSVGVLGFCYGGLDQLALRDPRHRPRLRARLHASATTPAASESSQQKSRRAP